MAINTLYDYYNSQGQALPSLSDRAQLYEKQGLGSASTYAGTSEQNTALLGKLQAPQLSVKPAPTLSLGGTGASSGVTTSTPATPTMPTSPSSATAPAVDYGGGNSAVITAPKTNAAGSTAVAPTTAPVIPPVGPLTSPASAPTTAGQNGTAPNLPVPQAPSTTAEFFASSTAALDQARATLEASYKTQTADYQAKIDAANKQIADFTATQNTSLDQIKSLTEPFQANLEATQRDLLYVNQNFQANQTLTNELGDLLTQGNDLIAQQKAQTGLAAIRDPRIAQTISDVTARAGVIQAVMKARNDQISAAYTMIDRTVAAMTADRKDQLSYYQAVYNFATSEKDTAGKLLVTLTSDQKDVLTNQINLLQSDLVNAQKNADNIKAAMQDPDKALAYASAGVTLNDTPQQIEQKLAQYAYSKEVATTSNEMAKAGYSYLPTGQKAPAGNETVTITDSLGNQKQWYKKSATTPAPFGTPSEADRSTVFTWLAAHPTEATSIDQQKLRDDPTYFYWVLNQTQQ